MYSKTLTYSLLFLATALSQAQNSFGQQVDERKNLRAGGASTAIDTVSRNLHVKSSKSPKSPKGRNRDLLEVHDEREYDTVSRNLHVKSSKSPKSDSAKRRNRDLLEVHDERADMESFDASTWRVRSLKAKAKAKASKSTKAPKARYLHNADIWN